jgi:hypothetical protein
MSVTISALDVEMTIMITAMTMKLRNVAFTQV